MNVDNNKGVDEIISAEVEKYDVGYDVIFYDEYSNKKHFSTIEYVALGQARNLVLGYGDGNIGDEYYDCYQLFFFNVSGRFVTCKFYNEFNDALEQFKLWIQ